MDGMLYETPFITIYCCVVMAIVGACLGSFLNCMAWRIVHQEPVTKGRSHCDLCGHVLGVRDLFPVLSWIFNKGRCRYCGGKLSVRHVLGEVISAAVYVSLLLRFDLSVELIEVSLLAALLLVCSFADLEGYVIPDRFIVAGVVIRLVFLALSDHVVAAIWDALLGGVAIAAILLLIVLIMEKCMGREAMGGGDLKLIFMIGLFLGWKRNLLCLLLSCIIGIVFGMVTLARQSEEEEQQGFPWGPSIAIAAWLCLLFGNQWIHAYVSLF